MPGSDREGKFDEAALISRFCRILRGTFGAKHASEEERYWSEEEDSSKTKRSQAERGNEFSAAETRREDTEVCDDC